MMRMLMMFGPMIYRQYQKYQQKKSRQEAPQQPSKPLSGDQVVGK